MEHPLIPCKCGCGELISSRDKKNRPRFFKNGHNAYLRLGENNPLWKGGKPSLDVCGYMLVYKPGHPRARSNRVGQHILIMEAYLGRSLTRHEIVHHRNGKRADNRIENLLLLPNQAVHMSIHRKTNCKNRKVDISGRACLICGSGETYVDKAGCATWRKYGDGFICNKCYCKIR